jgi:hypothetical protein
MDMWQCTECGAMFARVGPAAMYEGVTHCSKCVEVEVLTTMVGRLEAERDELLAACEAMKTAEEEHDWSDSGISNAFYDAIVQMRAAIALAKGEA